MGLDTVFKKAAQTGAKAFAGIFVPIEYETRSSTVYDPDPGLVLSSTTYENTKMMFDQYAQKEIDNERILPTDVKGVIPQNDLTITPVIGDSIFKIGDNVISDGGFDSSTSWDIGSGWSLSSSMAVCDGTQNGTIAQGSATLSSNRYIIGYDLALASGIVNSYVQGKFVFQHTASATSFKAKTVIGNGSNNISFVSQNSPNSFNGNIDNVVLYPVIDEYNVIAIKQDAAGAMWEMQLRKR